MFLVAIALLQAVSAPVPQTNGAVTDDGDSIVVLAKRYENTEKALAACLARHCPPKEEIDASLAHAENQFLAGDYAASRATLLKARSRNAKYAKELPVDVADLMRANGRLASLTGKPTEARINSIDSLDVLKEGLSENDPRVLIQRLEVGGYFARDGRFYAAREVYDRVAKQAHDAGLKQVEGFALLRTAVLYVAMADTDPKFTTSARDAIDKLEKASGPGMAAFSDAATTLRTRLDSGKRGRAQLVAENAKITGDDRAHRAILVYSPPIILNEYDNSASTTVAVHGSDTPEWFDVAFGIAPDGTVTGIKEVNQTAGFKDRWIDLVTDSLKKRLYRPLAQGVGELRRVERFSMVYDLAATTASRIRTPSGQPRLEVTDLTLDPPTG